MRIFHVLLENQFTNDLVVVPVRAVDAAAAYDWGLSSDRGDWAALIVLSSAPHVMPLEQFEVESLMVRGSADVATDGPKR